MRENERKCYKIAEKWRKMEENDTFLHKNDTFLDFFEVFQYIP